MMFLTIINALIFAWKSSTFEMNGEEMSVHVMMAGKPVSSSYACVYLLISQDPVGLQNSLSDTIFLNEYVIKICDLRFSWW